jgi:2-polyprenyl-3-methyl-5-hydroxy-6-metoxy-1,4-benzoquinol methylase
MPEIVEKCPVCAGNQFKDFLVCKDYTVSSEEFKIVSCQDCGFKFTNPRPNEAEIGTYYQSDEYISHSDTRKGLVNQMYHTVRKRALKGKLKLIEQIHANKQTKKILDFGCGTGAFLKTCQEAGWQITGIEPDAKAREIAQAQNQASFFENIAQTDFENKSFDVITLWHVLEHIHQLDFTIQTLTSWLKDTGSLIIALPNHQSKDAQIFGKYWAAYDVPRHLYHFHPASVQKLFDRLGMDLKQILPMYYDAYYISILSQKYEKGKANYFKAFVQGWQSNQWAKQHQNNYSSLIYILQKR